MTDLISKFKKLVRVEAAGCNQFSAANTTTDVTDGKVNIPAKPPKGLMYRIKMTGTKTGANNAMLVKLQIGATAVITLTADDATAVDWVAEITLYICDTKNQKASGYLLTNTADPEVDYAAGTVDLSAGAVMVPQITSANASDTVTCESVTVESWEL
jgi:hypothetical protein